jgi:hypothetical protein
MIQNVLTSIGGISAYGVVSICLFVAVYLALLIWACSRKKEYLRSMSVLPLDGGEGRPAGATENNPISERP